MMEANVSKLTQSDNSPFYEEPLLDAFHGGVPTKVQLTGLHPLGHSTGPS